MRFPPELLEALLRGGVIDDQKRQVHSIGYWKGFEWVELGWVSFEANRVNDGEMLRYTQHEVWQRFIEKNLIGGIPNERTDSGPAAD